MGMVMPIAGATSGMGRETAILLARVGHAFHASASRENRMEDLSEYGIIPVEMDVSKGEVNEPAVRSSKPSWKPLATPAAPRCRRGRDTPPATPELLVATHCYDIATSDPANAPAGGLGKAVCSGDYGVYGFRIRSKSGL